LEPTILNRYIICPIGKGITIIPDYGSWILRSVSTWSNNSTWAPRLACDAKPILRLEILRIFLDRFLDHISSIFFSFPLFPSSLYRYRNWLFRPHCHPNWLFCPCRQSLDILGWKKKNQVSIPKHALPKSVRILQNISVFSLLENGLLALWRNAFINSWSPGLVCKQQITGVLYSTRPIYS